MKAQKLRGREKILSARIATIFILATLLIPTHLARAVPITIEITGEVTNFSDGTGLLNTIHVGSIFSGTYTYDSSTVDSGDGHHLHSSPYGIILSLGGYEFKTAPTHVGQFDMWIINDGVGNGVNDFYLVRSHENALLPMGIAVNLIRWDLNDSTHTAISSNVLPTTAPSLDAWDYNYVEIYGGNSQGGFYLGGRVTQAVPEPLTCVLMMIGVLFFRRRRKTIKTQKPRGRKGYLSARFVTFLAFATLLLPAPLAKALPITIEITGEVTSVGGDVGSVPSTIYAGVNFTGTYTYDSSTPDSETDPQRGFYKHDSPYGISIVLGGYEFKTAPDHVGQFNMWIADDLIGNGRIFPITIQPTTVSFLWLKFRENIPEQTWKWPDGTEDGCIDEIIEFDVLCDNDGIDKVQCPAVPYARLHNGTQYVSFSYTIEVPLEYKDENGQWIEFMSGSENYHEHIFTASGECSLKVTADNTQESDPRGPWQQEE